MTDIAHRVAGLTAEQRELLQQRLAKPAGIRTGEEEPIPRWNGPIVPTSGQERLWFDEQMDGGSAMYNVSVALRLEGRLDIEAVRGSLTAIVKRHDTLRTRYGSNGGRLQLEVVDASDVEVPVVELAESNGKAEGMETALERALDAEARRPIALEGGMLLRAVLYRLGADDHSLQITTHHMASDGWSVANLYREFAELYNAAVRGTEPSLPQLPIRYSDYARWMQDSARTSAREESAVRWAERLRESSLVLDLPADHARGAAGTSRGEVRDYALPADVVSSLREICAAERVTPFMVLLAALYAVLHRFTGETRFLIGAPMAARPRPETDPLIGFFANTLALPGDISGDPTFRELLHRTRAIALEAYGQQDVPFERVVQLLNPGREPGRSPLFQVMLAVERARTHAIVLDGLSVSTRPVHTRTSKFDLTIHAEDGRAGINASVEYNADLFEADTIDRLWSHLTTFMRNALVRPEMAVSAVPLLTDAERRRIVLEWNDTRAEYPRDIPLAGLLEAQAERTPDAVAVKCGGESLSYRELHERANRLSHELSEHGAGPDTLVGLYVERSIEMMLALVAIIKAGAAYVPIDPSLPAERIRYMLSDSELRILVTQSSLLASLPEFEGTIVDMDGDGWKANSPSNPSVDVGAESLAYVIYTSGSTGRPKGVEIPRRALTNLLWSMREKLQLTAADRVLGVTTISFDIAGADVWLPLLVGATIVLARREDAADGDELRRLIDRHDITFLQATPATYSLLFGAGWQGKADLQCASSGEAMPADLAARLIRSVGRFWNLYGPTETTVWSTGMRLRDPVEPVLVGRPIANTQCYILDARGEPQPAGVIGELCIAGDGLARGYLNRADLTDEKFVANPFDGRADARMYRTGDLARYRADGNIECLGRTDDQIKIRGHRIEPGEIEIALKQHDAIRDAVVIARGDAADDRRLVAYVLPAGELPGPAELSGYLRKWLPEYMIPAAYVPLEAIPRTANGKIDRAMLPAPAGGAASSGDVIEEPRTATEALVADIWKAVLRTDRVGITDDFFALGGHSLTATQVMTRLRAAAGVELPLRLLFENATIASLAAAVDARRDDVNRDANRVATSPGEAAVRGRAPLSFVQEQMWLVDQLEPGNTAYNIGCTIELAGPMDIGALQAALTEIVRRHAVLRTAFITDHGVPVQVVGPVVPVVLTVTELSSLAPPLRAERLREIERNDAELAFDLTSGTPIRFRLIQLDHQLYRLIVAAHHIVIDGWSLQIFVNELGVLYTAFTGGQPSPLPEPAWQYADFAAWQRETLQGTDGEDMLEFWRAHLDGAPPVLNLPLDHPRPSVRTFGGGAETATLTPVLAQKVAALARSEGATVFMVMLAAFELLLSRLAGEDDVVVGIPIAGRTRVETETMLGCFLNTLPLRVKLDGRPSFRELLRRVRGASMDAYAHQGVPFDLLVERLRPQRSLSHAPFFQVLFNMLNMPGGGDDVAGLSVVRRSEGEAMAKFDLTMYLEERPEGIQLRLVYSTDIVSAKRAAAMLSQYTHLLSQIVDAPETAIGSYSLVPSAHARLLPDPAESLSAAWNGSVPQIVSGRARLAPDSVAVMDCGIAWTYRELEERSNRLAHHLIALGAGPGEIVAIHAERSGALVWALASVLKTGAGFVILDRAYPAARLAEYVEAARPRVVLRLAESGELPAAVRTCVSKLGGIVCDMPEFSRGDVMAAWRARPAVPPDVTIGADDTAYIAFTSGTTGRPKGIVGRHGSLTHFTPWIASEFGISATDRFSMVSGLAHDPLHRDVFTALQLGACVCVPRADAIYDPDRVVRWVRDSGVTVAHLTPAMGQLLSSSHGVTLNDLRLAFFVGDMLTRRDVARLHAIAPRLQIINYYGTTETQRAVSYHRVIRETTPDDGAESVEERVQEVVPLGRGTPDVQLLVITPSGGLAGVGEVGELYTRSPHIAKGYLSDEQLSAERFVANPVSGDPSDRCYRTGDLGRYDPDGEVRALGRIDTQVKIRGFRIEPGELEGLIGRHPHVRDCVVTTYADARGDRQLAAYVTGYGHAPDVAALRALVSERVPVYMHISSFTVLDEMPLTPNGKVDRSALPAPVAGDVRRTGSEWERRPRNRAEEEIANIWKDLLNVPFVGHDDDFFELGGHSLLAVAMMDRVAKVFDSRPPLSVLFEEPTVRHLAQVMVAKAGFKEPRAVCIQSGEEGRTPFFLFHGDYMAAGLYARKLVKHLDPGIPVFVLGPHFPGGPETIEEMAADAIPYIREVQETGPYLLGGYCNGGVVALEVAQQLAESGEAVEFLCVIDIDARNVQLAGLSRAMRRVMSLAGMDPRRQTEMFLRIHEPALRFVEQELPRLDGSSGLADRLVFTAALVSLITRRTARRGWRAALRMAGRNGQPDRQRMDAAGELRPDEQILRARSAHITRALLGYVPRPYDGRITVIGAEAGRLGRHRNQFRDWQAIGAQVDTFMIPGDHSTIVTSQIDGLARVISEQMLSAGQGRRLTTSARPAEREA